MFDKSAADRNSTAATGWRRPEVLLVIMAVAMSVAFSTWMDMINNFAVERAKFTGVEIGFLQSFREIPGFLSFAVVFLLFLMREQTIALAALVLLGLGTAATGFFPNFVGLCVTTMVMSVGFHYYEAVAQSLALQWLDKDKAAHTLGKIIAAGSLASLGAFAFIYLAIEMGGLDMVWVYVIGGGATVIGALAAWTLFPHFPEAVEQKRKLFLRKRYWLYYALTFMRGARRQIFVVFAGFLMVEKFGFSVSEITLMYLVNHVINMVAAPALGRLIGKWGERKALSLEYLGLVGVFVAYAFVETPWIAVGLYIADHFFFAMAIAIKTYFQKIADPADMASQAGVAFSINHIAAVVIPAAFGFLWLVSPSAVFLVGAAMAAASLALSLLIPENPSPQRVALVGRWKALAPLAAREPAE
ncbi:MAG: MFS transporter [Hyphomicrobiales bacterium]|nr:MFS transporter [Hyphomicrobiales bacterium]MCP5372672.1 MFS transporter [Hyphomicrobiales bacterium]